MESLRSYSKILTEASSSGELPHHKYTLRGVCTEPHVTYVLKRRVSEGSTNGCATSADDEYQWWRISFSTDDAKNRQAGTSSEGDAALHNSDVIGYTARKVREIEVLRAAREESKNVLLVYANNNAMNVPEEPAPSQLQVRQRLLIGGKSGWN